MKFLWTQTITICYKKAYGSNRFYNLNMASTLLLPFFLYSLILQTIYVVAKTKSTIAIGDSFTAETSNSTWLLSPSGDFAFGFLPIKDTDHFLLSIWYAKIYEKTVVVC